MVKTQSINIMSHRIITSMDKIYILSGNLTVWLFTGLTTFAFTGEEFRAWTSWGLGCVVGVLTIIKLCKGKKSK
tara:strand:- start:4044 stop:4265 length:222 start_codon:yes stop_codon:yes gene_type:complete